MNNVSMEKEQINVAELLKDCPKGMELDSPLFDDFIFDYIEEDRMDSYPIHCLIKSDNDPGSFVFTKNGHICDHPQSKCVIFPKGKTTWEDFVPPCKFDDGDILAYSTSLGTTVFIHRNKNGEHTYKTSFYAGINSMGMFLTYNKDTLIALCGNCDVRLATEEEKETLFQAIKDNGYRWNSGTKSLEKLVTPKFKVGDRIKHKDSGSILMIDDIDMSDSTYCCGLDHVWVADQDEYELVCPKFNMSALKPFERVLVRNSDDNMWCASMFSHTWKGTYLCAGMLHTQCIPYEGNEHLLGTTNSCDEFFRTWKLPK